MAKKDTIRALVKREISEEIATLLANKFNTLGGIAEAGVDGIIAVGVSAEQASLVIEKVGKRSTSSRTSSKKAAAASEEIAEPSIKLEEVTEVRDLSETEIKLKALADKFGFVFPPKIIYDIASRIENADLTEEQLEQIMVVANRMYTSHLMDQNESAGVMAAHSIGEPGTQMNLRTFHFAGVASVSVTQGLPRLIEIVDARREPSTPSMHIPLKGLAGQDEALAERVASEIEITSLLDVAKILTDINNMRLIIVPEPSKMNKRGVTVDDIVEKLGKIKAVRGNVTKTTAFLDDNIAHTSSEYNVEITTTESSYKKLQQMFDAVKNAKLKGVDGIKRAILEKSKTTGLYTIITEGSNLREILAIDGVDSANVMTNSVLEVAEVFGIEAARNSIVHEAVTTLSEAGLDVDIRHIMLVADLMTNDGTVRAIGRHGVSGKKSSVLARAAFEITAAHLLHAAMVGEVDNLEGVTENIIVGQPVTLGTGAVNLEYSPKKSLATPKERPYYKSEESNSDETPVEESVQ
ncbi:MAG: DNA-directed RNA polymerase subunit A'' [archaeon]|nr:DNA-directed RNA polymerase subunit A'' [archaeon]